MKKTLLALALGTLFLDASAQELTGADLKEIASSFVKDGPTTALQNALTAEANLRKLALNRDLQGKIDHYFKYRVEVKGITDQKQSGRCWMFTSMNVQKDDCKLYQSVYRRRCPQSAYPCYGRQDVSADY